MKRKLEDTWNRLRNIMAARGFVIIVRTSKRITTSYSVGVKSKVSIDDEKRIKELVTRHMEIILEVVIDQLSTDACEREYVRNVG